VTSKKTVIGDPKAHKQIQKHEEQKRKLEHRTAHRVKAWNGLQEDDYDFRSWAKDASKNCLHAGVVYEYARESRKLRCLLVLMNPKRQRKSWEMVRPAMVDGKRPDQSNPSLATPLPCLFEDLDEHEGERALDGFLYCLADLADYLADNISFAELFRTRRDELEKAFGGLDRLSTVKRRSRYFLRIKPVRVATQSEAEQATVFQTITADEKRIILGENCSEVIALRIAWRFTDSEITAAFKKFLRKDRPRNEAYKPQQGKRGSRRDSVEAALDCLSAMRLASHFPKIPPRDATGAFAAYCSGDPIKAPASAIDLFNEIRLGGHGGPIAESNFDGLIVQARRLFQESFPFGEDAANAPKDRIMMKPERISSQDKI
jgi:hypothetical protein